MHEENLWPGHGGHTLSTPVYTLVSTHGVVTVDLPTSRSEGSQKYHTNVQPNGKSCSSAVSSVSSVRRAQALTSQGPETRLILPGVHTFGCSGSGGGI